METGGVSADMGDSPDKWRAACPKLRSFVAFATIAVYWQVYSVGSCQHVSKFRNLETFIEDGKVRKCYIGCASE